MNSFSGYASGALNTTVVTTGSSGSKLAVSGTFPGTAVNVFDHGTLNLSAIFSTATAAQDNPFLAGSDGSFAFLGAAASYDLVFTGPGTVATATSSQSVTVGVGSPLSLLLGGTGLTSQWFLDVRSYGATGDGITDDAPAIQAAINALPTLEGGTVYFPHPSSFYKVGTTITIGKGVRLVGSGKHDATIANIAGGPSPVITTTSGGGGGMEICNLQIQCKNTNDIAVQIKGVDRVHIHDCYLFSTVPLAVLLQLDRNGVAGAYTHRIVNNIFQFPSGNASQIAISLVGGITSTVFFANHIQSDNAISEVPGASAHGGNVILANLLSSVTSGPTGTGVAIAGGAAPSANTIIAFNYFDHYVTGISLASGTTLMMLVNNIWDQVTTKISDANAAGGGGSILDMFTKQMAIGTTTLGTAGTYMTQGNGATDVIGYRTNNTNASGRGWSILSGSSAQDEFGIRDDTAGNFPTKWNASGLTHTKRHRQALGANVAAANDLTLGIDGNMFHITGATQINAITVANWSAGSEVRLIFDSTPTVKHNTAGGGGTAKLILNGAADLVAAANNTLTLGYDGTSWFELGRKV